jgi:hypothetical protein
MRIRHKLIKYPQLLMKTETVFWISYLDMVPQEVFCTEETGALVTHDEIQHLLLRNSFF